MPTNTGSTPKPFNVSEKRLRWGGTRAHFTNHPLNQSAAICPFKCSPPHLQSWCSGEPPTLQIIHRGIFLKLQTQASTNRVFKWDQHFAFPKLETPRHSHLPHLAHLWHYGKHMTQCETVFVVLLHTTSDSPSPSSTPLSSAHIWPNLPIWKVKCIAVHCWKTWKLKSKTEWRWIALPEEAKCWNTLLQKAGS